MTSLRLTACRQQPNESEDKNMAGDNLHSKGWQGNCQSVSGMCVWPSLGMMLVKVSENQDGVAFKTSRLSVVRKTSPGSPFRWGVSARNPALARSHRPLVPLSQATGEAGHLDILLTADRHRHRRKAASSIFQAADSWRARNRLPGQERCEADSGGAFSREPKRGAGAGRSDDSGFMRTAARFLGPAWLRRRVSPMR